VNRKTEPPPGGFQPRCAPLHLDQALRDDQADLRPVAQDDKPFG
jgi:hypothetical protein